MKKVYCDFHVHSCLSPCGDDMMTPSSAAGMLMLAGINAAALTDHNSTKNCPTFFKACLQYGVTPIAGMELTTSEEVHMVCLFPTLESGMAFGDEVEKHRIRIKNKPVFFGNQYIMDMDDNIVGVEEFLLPNATDLSLVDGYNLVREFGGICYPAHVDRESNGILTMLGDIPDEPTFKFAEYNNTENIAEYHAHFPKLAKMRTIYGSDAHRLEDVRDASFYLELSDEGSITDNIFALLKE